MQGLRVENTTCEENSVYYIYENQRFYAQANKMVILGA